MFYRDNELRALLEGRSILLAGYGREGKSSERMIRRLLPDADIAIAEGNDQIRDMAGRGFDLIVKSPGVPLFVLEDLCPLDRIISQTDLFLQVYADHVLGVTGTKGKSTTTNLIAEAMRCHNPHTIMAGNMGIPLFDIVDTLADDAVVVAEFSCHQLENIHRSPHVGIVLNLFEEHLDHYHSYLDYQMAKMQIAMHQQSADHFFYCSDNATLALRVEEHKNRMQGTVTAYSLHHDLARSLSALPSHLQGDHNLSNIVVARMATQVLGVTDTEFASALASFQGLEHRLELIGTYSGITFYNDSISTIPQACIAAVESLKKVDTLILGGFDRGIDYEPLARFIATSAVRNIAFVGNAGLRIKDLLDHNGWSQSHCSIVSNNYEEIVRFCFDHTAPGTICLLSPAAASYDAFKNFEHRGQVFKQLVRGEKQ